ncbi:MAG: NTE family protein [Flavobacteriales bacterium]|jgi:NTE family protein
MVKNTTLSFLFFLLALCSHSQTVGVVLSGGGSSALSHIGVLKALEEHHIPIDYITGTSMGAIIGAMYASGYSPAQMEELVLKDDFQEMILGNDDPKYRRFLPAKPNTAAMISIRFYIDSLLETSVPTNYVKPYAMDFNLLEMFAPISAAANYNFDSLMIPFRCVAADITNKRQVVFSEGNIERAIRASASYPFYYNPISIDGNLLYDGGLYNNFPADILCENFNPDFVIGSNVSYNYEAPNENNLFSIIKNMLVKDTDYSIKCGKGIIIKPENNVATFDFSSIQVSIDSGYVSTIRMMDQIKASVTKRTSTIALYSKRIQFRKKVQPLIINKLEISGLNKTQQQYVSKSFGINNEPTPIQALKGKYYRIFANDKIKYIFPRATQQDTSSFYSLQLDVTREKDLLIEFGGNFSSKAINTGYVGFKYNYLGGAGISLEGNSYFGNFYSSVITKVRIDYPSKLPIVLEPVFAINQLDYFNGQATFFEESRPSFKINRESYYGISSELPFIGAGKFKVDYKRFHQDYQYYQIENFTEGDTNDVTAFDGYTYGASYALNTLNYKQFPNEGALLTLTGRVMNGVENTTPGSTTIKKEQVIKDHSWLQLKVHAEKYFRLEKRVKVGVKSELFLSQQPFYQNYTATLMSSAAFQPTLDSKTQFLDAFRAHRYVGAGIIAETNLWKNLVFRGEAYVFQPFEELLTNEENGEQFRGTPLTKRRWLVTGTVLFRNLVAPLSLSVNYNDSDKNKIGVMFNFGFLLFNPSVTD